MEAAELGLDELVGRDREIDDLAALLEEARLVTVTGLGGSGKTRLAEAVLAGWRRGRGPGAFVDLAPVADPAAVAGHVAAALALDDALDASLHDAVARRVAGRPYLLVLDNMEHVRGAGGLLRQVALASPTLRLLVTSRVPLGVAGEHEFALAPLGVTPLEPGLPAPAAVLFLRAARRVGWQPRTDRDHQAVGEICRLLGGLPLAIELAAARTRLLSPAAIAARLARHLPVLPRAAPGDGSGDALDTILAWTVDLLGAESRERFWRLAVFPGTFGLRFAAAVWPGSDALEQLDELVRLSLVRRVPGEEGGDERFELLVPVRDYALARLVEGPGSDEPMALLADEAARFATVMRRMLAGPGQGEAFRRARAERDTIRAAIEWLAPADPERAAAIVLHLGGYWSRGGALAEGRDHCARLLGGDGLADGTRAELLSMLALTTVFGPRPDDAAGPAARAVELASRLGRRDVLADALLTLGLVEGYRGDTARSIEHLRAANEATRDLGDPGREVRMLGNLGVTLAEAGQVDEGIGLLEAAAELARSIGDEFALAMNLANLAETLIWSGHSARARAPVDEAIAGFSRLGPSSFSLWAGLVRAALLLQLAKLDEAAGELADLTPRVIEHGSWEERARLLEYAATVLVGMERMVDATRLFAASARVRTDAGLQDAVGPEQKGFAAARREAERVLGRRAFEALVRDGTALDPDALVRAIPRLLLAAAPARALAPRGISRRETEVLRLVAGGASDGEIADDLGISPKTASVHVSNLKRKLAVESRVQLALAGRELLESLGPASAPAPPQVLRPAPVPAPPALSRISPEGRDRRR